MRQWLDGRVGAGYDFVSVFRFVTRRDKDDSSERWFCSELAAGAFQVAGHYLLHQRFHLVTPGMLAASPLLCPANGFVRCD